MTTAQAALNSLRRSLKYAKDQLDSKNSLYSAGIKQFTEIKELADEISRIAAEMLAKSEVAVKDSISSYSELCEATKAVSKKSNTQLSSNSYAKNFKSIVSKTSANAVKSKNSISEDIVKCAEICATYFTVRFDKRFDKNNIHRFKIAKLPDYLYSLIFAYSKALSEGELGEFLSNFDFWIDEVKQGSVKYSLPKDAAFIFFNKKADINYIFEFQNIWNSLWELGYCEIAHLEFDTFKVDKFSPFKYFTKSDAFYSCDKYSVEELDKSTVFNQVCAAVESELSITIQQDQRNEIEPLCYAWLELVNEPTYDLFRAIAISNTPELRVFNYSNNVKLKEGTLFKSLIFYILKEGENGIQKVISSMDRIFKKLKYLDSICSDISSMYEIVKEEKPSDLDLIEVLTHYVENYKGVSCGQSEPLVVVE